MVAYLLPPHTFLIAMMSALRQIRTLASQKRKANTARVWRHSSAAPRPCAELVMLLEWWSGTECTLYTDQATVDKFGKEHVIIILNHNFEIDFLCGWTMCERYGILGVSGPLELCFLPSLCLWVVLFKTRSSPCRVPKCWPSTSS